MASATLAGSFSGLYLLTRGLPVDTVGWFYLIAFVSAVGACLAFSRVGVTRYGTSIAAYAVVSAGFYASLLLLPAPWFIVLPPVLWGASIPLFWLPFNVLLVSLTRRENRGMILGLSSLSSPWCPSYHLSWEGVS